jgi:hypothetical protein
MPRGPIARGAVLVVCAAFLTASAMPPVLIALPVLRDRAGAGQAVMVGLFVGALGLGASLLRHRR